MPAPKRFSIRRKRICKFCAEKITYIDFKDGKHIAAQNQWRLFDPSTAAFGRDQAGAPSGHYPVRCRLIVLER
jgi:hypothetical protein